MKPFRSSRIDSYYYYAPLFAAGDTVRLHGLTRPGANGKEGVVESYDSGLERYAVRLDGHQKAVMVKPENVRAAGT